jgi:vacuolar-type H+-ATPase subunit F/Vma7
MREPDDAVRPALKTALTDLIRRSLPQTAAVSSTPVVLVVPENADPAEVGTEVERALRARAR